MFTLYTPILPARTGTADYADLLLRDIHRAGIPPEALRVVVDDEQIDLSRAAVPGGYAVVPHRAVVNVVLPGETAIYLVANNEFHGYVHASLRDVVKAEGARIVVVVHEPCCAMLLNSLCYKRRLGFSDTIFVENLSAQYGAAARQHLEAFRRGELPPIFEFVSHALGPVLKKADEVWTHSAFAALKLALESNVPPAALPRFRLVEHPDYDYEERTSPASASRGGRFVIGVFGWVSPPKRVIEAIEGYYRFLCRLAPEDIERTSMVVVGALPDPRDYDPEGLAGRLGLAERIEFLDFVDGERFKALQASCSMLVNLRFPSCGETSGTLKHAAQNGTPTVTTSYQAFREAPGERISFLPGLEIEGIVGAMSRAFEDWKRGATTDCASGAHRSPASRIESLLAAGLFRRGAGQAHIHREQGSVNL